MARVLIAGCGYVGSVLGEILVGAGHDVWGLRRRAASVPVGVRSIEADLGVAATLAELPQDLDTVFYMAAPGGAEDALYRTTYVAGLRNLLKALDQQKQQPQRVFFVSSTAVYGQQDGERVDETSPTEPVHFSGRRLLEAERVLFDGPFPGTVVRFGGIYGPRRSGLVERVRAGRAVFRDGPDRFTNRIHRDDCAGVLHHLMQQDALEPLYLGVDAEPAEEGAVLRWLAGVLGSPMPRGNRETDTESADRSRSNKRCSNARLVATGYQFRYPTFREGYSAIVADLA